MTSLLECEEEISRLRCRVAGEPGMACIQSGFGRDERVCGINTDVNGHNLGRFGGGVREGAPRQEGCGRQPPAMRKRHEGAGRNFLGEFWEGILHVYNTAIMKVGSTLFYRRYVIEAIQVQNQIIIRG